MHVDTNERRTDDRRVNMNVNMRPRVLTRDSGCIQGSLRSSRMVFSGVINCIQWFPLSSQQTGAISLVCFLWCPPLGVGAPSRNFQHALSHLVPLLSLLFLLQVNNQSVFNCNGHQVPWRWPSSPFEMLWLTGSSMRLTTGWPPISSCLWDTT